MTVDAYGAGLLADITGERLDEVRVSFLAEENARLALGAFYAHMGRTKTSNSEG